MRHERFQVGDEGSAAGEEAAVAWRVSAQCSSRDARQRHRSREAGYTAEQGAAVSAKRVLPIWIGQPDAQALALALRPNGIRSATTWRRGCSNRATPIGASHHREHSRLHLLPHRRRGPGSRVARGRRAAQRRSQPRRTGRRAGVRRSGGHPSGRAPRTAAAPRRRGRRRLPREGGHQAEQPLQGTRELEPRASGDRPWRRSDVRWSHRNSHRAHWRVWRCSSCKSERTRGFERRPIRSIRCLLATPRPRSSCRWVAGIALSFHHSVSTCARAGRANAQRPYSSV